MKGKTSNRKMMTILSCIIVLGMTLSACASSESSSEGKDDKKTQKGDDRKLADKQELHLSSGDSLRTLDLSLATDENSLGVLTRVKSGLLIYKDNELEPDIAKDMPEVNDDNTQYTFTIRDDAKWSDGSPITAEDFVYSWRRALDPDMKSQYSYMFKAAHIKNADEIGDDDSDMYGQTKNLGVKAKDKHTLVVTLSQSTPEQYFNSLMQFTPFFPLKKEFVKKEGKKYAQEPGNLLYNGAYKLKNWDHGEGWTLVKNDDYWDADDVTIDKVTYKIVKDPKTSLKLYKSDKVDRTGLVAEDVDKYKDNKEFKEVPDTGVFYWDFNRDKVPEFKNKKLRQAFFLAINRKSFTDVILNNGSIPANYIVPKNFATGPDGKGFHEKGSIADPSTYPNTDKEKAKKLWKEAKDELGIDELSVEMMTTDGDLPSQIVEYYANQLTKTLDGLHFKINKQPYKSYVDLKAKGEIELGVGEGWWPDYEDPMAFLELFTTDNPQNTYGLSDKTYDHMIAQATKNGDHPKKRWEILQKAEKYLIDNALVVPTYQSGAAILSKDYLGGITNQANGIQTFYRHAKVYKH